MSKARVNQGTADEWIARARSALAIASRKPEPPIVVEDLCFQAQQAAEKALKAVCRDKGIDFRSTHDLDELAELLGDNAVPITEEVDDATILTRYAVQTRYPSLAPALTESDWIEAVGLAKGVVRWASLMLGMDPGVDLDDLFPGSGSAPGGGGGGSGSPSHGPKKR
jgi:HEPN domain-containing protein